MTPGPYSLLNMYLNPAPVDHWLSYGALCAMHYDVDLEDGWRRHTFTPLKFIITDPPPLPVNHRDFILGLPSPITIKDRENLHRGYREIMENLPPEVAAIIDGINKALDGDAHGPDHPGGRGG